MKISAEQKERNRQALIRAAVEVISSVGFEAATLRQISHAAGLSEPVIYKYFPNKSVLLFSYFTDSVHEALERLLNFPNFTQMSAVDQIRSLMETHLEILNEDRDFVREVFSHVFVTGLITAQEGLTGCRDLFKTFVNDCLQASIDAGELTDPPFPEVIASMFWDYHTGLISYWIKDQSALQTNTSKLIQHSLSVIGEILKSQFLSKLVELSYFLIRTHLLIPKLDGPTSETISAKMRPKILDLLAKNKESP